MHIRRLLMYIRRLLMHVRRFLMCVRKLLTKKCYAMQVLAKHYLLGELERASLR